MSAALVTSLLLTQCKGGGIKMYTQFRHSGQKAICIVIGASFIVGAAAGCRNLSVTADSSPAAVVTAGPSAPTVSAQGKLASKSKPRRTRRKHARPQPTVSQSAVAPTLGSAPTTPAPVTSAPTLDPTTPAPVTSAPTVDPTTATPTATATQAPSTGPAAFVADCPARASTSASGCGSWDAGASSGQAPGFATGQQASPNLLGVNQDPWSGSQGAQELTASSFQDWSVTATDTDPSDSPGEVLTYPDASFNYYQVSSTPPAQYDLNNITSLTSDFAESMPDLSNLDAEAAYDLWLNDWQTEVMVWVDTSPGKDRNLADSGDTEVGTYTYDGQNFSLWRNGSGITGFYIFLLDHNETSGTVDLKAMLETLVSLGEIPATSPLTEIPFGWEISDTGGQPVTFSLSKFDVNLQN
jgi:hypothetical protein